MSNVIYKTYIIGFIGEENKILSANHYLERVEKYPQASSLLGFLNLIEDLHYIKHRFAYDEILCIIFNATKIIKVEKVPASQVKKARMLL